MPCRPAGQPRPEFGTVANRYLDWGHIGAEPFTQIVDDRLGVGVVPVDTTHDQKARTIKIGSQTPHDLCSHFNPRRGVDEYRGGVGRVEAGYHLAHKVGIARRVDDVDLQPVPLTGDGSQIDGHAPLVLVRVVVGNRVVFFDPTKSRRFAGDVVQRLG